MVAFGILALEQRGYRRFELAICGLLGIVFLGFAYDLAAVGTDPGAIAPGWYLACRAAATASCSSPASSGPP